MVYSEGLQDEDDPAAVQGTDEDGKEGTGVAMHVAQTPDGDRPSKYFLAPKPYNVTVVKPDPDKPDPKLGVGLMAWSCGDRFLATRNDNMPHTLWVWDTRRLLLCSVVNQIGAIKEAAWDPKRSRLALCTGNKKLYMWSAEGCSIVDIPTQSNFGVKSLRWCPDGNAILLLDKSKFCCCYLDSASVD